MKRWGQTVLLVAVLISMPMALQAADGENVQVTVDGAAVGFSDPILMVDMMLPLLPAQEYANALGATSRWDQGARQITIQRGAVTLEMIAGTDELTVDGTPQTIPFGARTFNGAPYVPGPAIARLLGLDAQWDAENLTLAIAVPVEMPEGQTFAGTLLEVRAGPPTSFIVRSSADGAIYEVPIADGAQLRRGKVGLPPTSASLDDLQPGDLLELILTDTGTAAGATATYLQTMGTIASIEANQLRLQDGSTYALGAGVSAVGSDGGALHLLGTVGEAAILRQNPDTGAVWSILSQRRGSSTPPSTDVPTVAGFFVTDYYGPVRAGDSFGLRVLGSAGGRATVTIGGTGRSLTLAEGQPGTYTGSFTVPNGIAVADQPLTVRLAVGGATSDQVQSNIPVTIDTSPPAITALSPAENAEITTRRPPIGARFVDQGPAGLLPDTLTLTVDGTDVTDAATVEADRATYVADGLKPGRHSASLTISDRAGNNASRTWHFEVAAEATGILTVQHDADGGLQPGDTLTVSMNVAAPGRAASFDIAGVETGIKMSRVPGENTYRGFYTIQDDDRARNATVTAHFTAADGTTYDAVAPRLITIERGEVAFAVTTPADGATVGRRITPAGTAPPGAQVRWKISYRKVILGGELGGGTVTAADDGTWRADAEVDLRVPLIGMGDAYTLTAELLGEDGAVQQTLTVEFEADD